MGLHKPFDRTFPTIGGKVKTSGGSLQLAKGQFAIVDVSSVTSAGAAVVSSFNNVPKNKRRYELRLGTSNLPVARSQDNKSYASFTFALEDVVSIKSFAPKETEQSVDEVLIGYDGVNASTAFDFNRGEVKKLFVKLSGERIGLLGYPQGEVVVPVYLEDDLCRSTDCADCDPCESADMIPIVLDAVRKLKESQLIGGLTVEDFVEVTPIIECDNAISVVTTDQVFYTISLCDTGDQSALAIVQSQYEDEVIRISRVGATSTYQILTDAGAPTDFQHEVASIIKGCDVCPAGYTAATGGFLYAVTLEDDGTDESAAVEALANAVVGTATLQGRENGVGFYTVVLSAELSAVDRATFIATSALEATSTIELVGTVEDICAPDAESTTAWVAGETCTTTVEQYEITLPDTVCGDDRLAELQEAYPYNTVAIALSEEEFKSAVITVTGTSGTANVNVDTVDYLMTFNTDIETTIDDFITAHAATIVAAGGATSVTKSSATTITIVYPTADPDITITNATGDLAGTVATTGIEVRQNCRTKYTIDVITNMVCEECSTIYEDSYTTGAPEQFEQTSWIKVTPEIYDGLTNCKTGIRIKGRVLEVWGDDGYRDQVGFIDSSVQIEASGGYITEVREGIGEIADESFSVVYQSRWKPRNNMGGKFYDDEDRSRFFHTGDARYRGADGANRLARFFKGQETALEPGTQYVDYQVTIKRPRYSQSFAGSSLDATTYHILAPVGLHDNVEALLNALAGGAGVEGVQAYGV